MRDIKVELEEYLLENNKDPKEIEAILSSSNSLAFAIAAYAHKGQTRRNGEPYLFHPVRMERAYQELTGFPGQEDYVVKPEILEAFRIPFEGIQELCMLHDVIEDTSITVEELEDAFEKCGMGPFFRVHVKAPLILITHDKEENYESYIKKISDNPSASMVKMLDLQDNLRLFGLDEIAVADLERSMKYLWYFTDLNLKHRFLEKLKLYGEFLETLKDQ